MKIRIPSKKRLQFHSNVWSSFGNSLLPSSRRSQSVTGHCLVGVWNTALRRNKPVLKRKKKVSKCVKSESSRSLSATYRHYALIDVIWKCNCAIVTAIYGGHSSARNRRKDYTACPKEGNRSLWRQRKGTLQNVIKQARQFTYCARRHMTDYCDSWSTVYNFKEKLHESQWCNSTVFFNTHACRY